MNQRPSFTAGADQTVLEDAGAQTVAGWATGISPGPANESAQAVSFTVTNDNPGLFSTQPAVAPNGTLTYRAAANANGVATVTVRAVDNGGTANGGNDTSPPQTFAITVSPVNDPPSFNAGPAQTVLETAGPQTVAAWATAISPGPANESAQTVSFSATNDNPGLFSTQPTVAPNGTLSYTPIGTASGVANITVTAADNAGTTNGGNDTSPPRTFAITVIAVNHAPTFSAGPAQTTVKSAGLQTVGGWATATSPGPANESGQTVSFIVTNDNNSIFAVQPAVAADGTLTYTPLSGQTGTATVTVRATDNGGTANGGSDTSAPQTFTITILPRNMPPSFAAGPNQSSLSVLGARTIPGWASAIDPGGADEAWQTVTFTVTNDNPGLFSVQPAVAPNGTLTYTPNLLALGSATVTVTAHDNGGTLNGGTDTSPPQTFTISVL